SRTPARSGAPRVGTSTAESHSPASPDLPAAAPPNACVPCPSTGACARPGRLSSTPVSLRSGTVAPSVQRSGEPPSHVVPPRTDSNPRLVGAWLQNGASREHQNHGERQRDFPSLMRRKIVPSITVVLPNTKFRMPQSYLNPSKC